MNAIETKLVSPSLTTSQTFADINHNFHLSILLAIMLCRFPMFTRNPFLIPFKSKCRCFGSLFPGFATISFRAISNRLWSTVSMKRRPIKDLEIFKENLQFHSFEIDTARHVSASIAQTAPNFCPAIISSIHSF
jgi:hypothetical protein